ncbi:unnamed protein product [Prorocentrum cordatum]|uniref:Uncharacterized protein n=1 Tax=Prorocentrum cordatum TaxID=2364126 RepID=A0ABN9T6Q8_9DINO|nr:unnamed protein product [Polarella glacialis]
MRMPAAFIAGSLVPLGFVASPKVSPEDGAVVRRVKLTHYLLATLAICSELQSIMWATIAANKLTEASHAPAAGVMQLLERDYQLEWIGCNVTFMIGLIGLAACLSTFAFVGFGGARRVALCFMAASMSMMVSIINTGISKGDGQGFGFGGNFFDLVVLYHRLLMARALGGHGFFCIASLLLYAATAALGVRELLRTGKEHA